MLLPPLHFTNTGFKEGRTERSSKPSTHIFSSSSLGEIGTQQKANYAKQWKKEGGKEGRKGGEHWEITG